MLVKLKVPTGVESIALGGMIWKAKKGAILADVGDVPNLVDQAGCRRFGEAHTAPTVTAPPAFVAEDEESID